MILLKLYLICISLLVMTQHGQAKPKDIHIHLHGAGYEVATMNKPENRIRFPRIRIPPIRIPRPRTPRPPRKPTKPKERLVNIFKD
jgi:hypothetical protein